MADLICVSCDKVNSLPSAVFGMKILLLMMLVLSSAYMKALSAS